MEPPGPIPNPEVKHISADGSRTIGPARVGRRQVIIRLIHLTMYEAFLYLEIWNFLKEGIGEWVTNPISYRRINLFLSCWSLTAGEKALNANDKRKIFVRLALDILEKVYTL